MEIISVSPGGRSVLSMTISFVGADLKFERNGPSRATWRLSLVP